MNVASQALPHLLHRIWGKLPHSRPRAEPGGHALQPSLTHKSPCFTPCPAPYPPPLGPCGVESHLLLAGPANTYRSPLKPPLPVLPLGNASSTPQPAPCSLYHVRVRWTIRMTVAL